MKPERFPQQAPRAVARDRGAKFAARNNTQARFGSRRQGFQIDNQTAVDEPLSLLAHRREVATLFEAHRAWEWPGGPVGGHSADQTGVRRLRPTRRRFLRMARPLLVELRLKKPCCRLRRI